jgi:hypothetical protein
MAPDAGVLEADADEEEVVVGGCLELLPVPVVTIVASISLHNKEIQC